MSGSNNAVSALGGWVRTRIAGIGYFTRFFGAMKAEIHALSMRTLTPAEYTQAGK